MITSLHGFAETYPRHINPDTLEVTDPGPSHLFQIYDLILANILNGDYDMARSVIVDAQEIEAGPKIGSILEDINGLLRDETDNLEMLRRHLSDAKSLLIWYKESEVETILDKASQNLLNATVTLNGLQVTMLESIEYLEGYETELFVRFTSLEDVLDAYSDEVQLLAEQARLIADLKRGEDPQLFPTNLSLNSNVTSTFLGSTIQFTGRLEHLNGSGTPSQTVYLYQDGLRISEIHTNEDGSFTYQYKIPFIYKDFIDFHVEFWPKEGTNLIPSLSNRVRVELEFDTPVFKIEPTEPVHPGDSTHLRGKLLVNDLSQPDIRITLIAFGRYKETVTDSDGAFSFEVQIPETVREGTHTLNIRSDPSYLTGPSGTKVSIMIVRTDIDITYEPVSWAISGNYVTVKGRLETGAGPLEKCLVVVRGDLGLHFTSSGAQGEFNLDINIPENKLSSLYHYTIYAVPSQGWLRTSAVNSNIFIFNIYFITGLSLTLIAVLTYQFMLSRGRLNWVLSETGQSNRITVDQGDSRPKNFYELAVNVIAGIVGLVPESSVTIREYLEKVKSKLSVRMYSIFERLSLFYERLVYGGKKTDVSEGESLLEMMKDQTDET